MINEIEKNKKEYNTIQMIENADMSQFTTFKSGGKAELLVVVKNEDDLIDMIKTAREKKLKFCILGNGSNVLVQDGGYDGLIIKIDGDEQRPEIDGVEIKAFAGIMLSQLAREAMENSLSGLEFAAGIPGTVGGAVFMNAGAYDGEISFVFKECKVLDLRDLSVKVITKSEMDFSYRHTALENEAGQPEMIVLSATFVLKRGCKDDIQKKMKDFNNRRLEKQPLNYPSGGSFFKRPEGYFAGKLIEDSGLKGLTFGGAAISEKHSGFIINKSGATAGDIITLMEVARAVIYGKFGVVMEPEVRIIGNK